MSPKTNFPSPGQRSVQIKAVCTIEGLDRPTETVTLTGRLGRYASVGAADAANVPHLRIGDTVLVTYKQAPAIALEKSAKHQFRHGEGYRGKLP